MWKPIDKEDSFRSYLEEQPISKKHVQNCISRCRKVNHWEGNIYIHYTNDQGKSLISRLSYSKEDAERCIEPKHNLPIDGNKGYLSILEGTASLRNAIQRYFEYLREYG